MSAGFTQEHDDLRQLVRSFLEQRSTSAHIRELIAQGRNRDDAVWRQMAEQLGLQGLVIPEEYGGAGFGAVELGIVMEEMGRVLAVTPYFGTVALAAQTLVTSGDDAAMSRWLPGIADGTVTATLALAEESGSWDPAAVTTTAEETAEGWTLTGTKAYVVDGGSADLVLVVARAADGLGVFAVEAGATGLTATRVAGVDLTRELAVLSLERAAAVRVGAQRDIDAWLSQVRDLVLTALAAEQVGGASRSLEITAEYAKTREQFGRPIGSFQAIKQKCATVLLEVESARAAAYAAAEAVAEERQDADIAAALAKAYGSSAYTLAAKEMIQVHGGIGFTWEHDAHLYLRRATSSAHLFGAPVEHRARLAGLLGL